MVAGRPLGCLLGQPLRFLAHVVRALSADGGRPRSFHGGFYLGKAHETGVTGKRQSQINVARYPRLTPSGCRMVVNLRCGGLTHPASRTPASRSTTVPQRAADTFRAVAGLSQIRKTRTVICDDEGGDYCNHIHSDWNEDRGLLVSAVIPPQRVPADAGTLCGCREDQVRGTLPENGAAR